MSTLSRKQEEVLRISLKKETRYVLLGGSVGSGKSTLASIICAAASKATYMKHGGLILIIAKTVAAAHNNIVENFKNEEVFGELARDLHIPPQATTFTAFGERFEIITGNDSRAPSKVQGRNAKIVIMDEAAELDRDLFVRALNRLRWGEHTKMIATFNPRHPKHWLKVDYIDAIDHPKPGKEALKDRGWVHFRLWMGDNPGLPEGYAGDQKAAVSGVDYLRDICGEWVADAGRVYDVFEEDEHVVPWHELPVIDEYIALGVDYGDTASSAGVLLGWSSSEQKLYAVDEWGYEAGSKVKQLAPTILAERLAVWLHEPHANQAIEPQLRGVFIDPGGGGTSFANQLILEPSMGRFSHVVHTATKKPGSLIGGVSVIKSLLARKSLLISSRCEKLIQELNTYAYDTEASDRRGEAVFARGNDHYCDALRYAITATQGLWQHAVNLPHVVSAERLYGDDISR